MAIHWVYEYADHDYTSQRKAYEMPGLKGVICYPGKHEWRTLVKYRDEVCAQVCKCGLIRWIK